MAKYSSEKIRRMISESDNAPNSYIKGEKLEELVRYIFDKVPGVSFYEKNILDQGRTHEIDLAFWNLQIQSQLSFLDPVIIVECKNTGRALGSSRVGWFVRKLQDSGVRYGILVSLSGITGESDSQSNAHSEILDAQKRDGIKILVIKRQELFTLSTTNDLSSLLQRKILKLTLHKIAS